MDAAYLNSEMRRLAAVEPPDFGDDVTGDYKDGAIYFKGSVLIDDDYFKWFYEHPNVFDENAKPQWTVLQQDKKPADKDLRSRAWQEFGKNMLPSVIMRMSKNPSYRFPKSYLKTIPGLAERLKMFEQEKPTEEHVREMIDWDGVKDPGWHKEKGKNWREGLLTVTDPLTKEKSNHVFRYEEGFELRPGGKYRYTHVGIKWVDKLSGTPKRQKEMYERAIMGEVAKAATEEAEEQHVMAEPEEPLEVEAPPEPEAEGQPEAPAGPQVEFTKKWDMSDTPTSYGTVDGKQFTVTVFNKDFSKADYQNIAVAPDELSDEQKKAVQDAVLEQAGGGSQ